MGKPSIASRMAIGESSYYELLNSAGNYEIAAIVGVSERSLQYFLLGTADQHMADRLGMLEDELQAILNKIGKEGAIGMTIGILIENAKK